MNAISSPSVPVDYCLRKNICRKGLAIDTRPFPELHATDQWRGSPSPLSLLLSTVSCVGSVDKISVLEICGCACQIGTTPVSPQAKRIRNCELFDRVDAGFLRECQQKTHTNAPLP